MADSDVAVTNSALIRLGADPITSFEDGDDIATICGDVYPNLRNSILSAYPWQFTRDFQQLSQEVASPLARWSVQYHLHPRRLSDRLMAVFETSNPLAQPIRDFYVAGGKLYTERIEIWVEFPSKDFADETKWPSYFRDYIVQTMMAAMAPAVTEKATLSEFYYKIAYGTPEEAGQGGLTRSTRSIDARGRPSRRIVSNALRDARRGQ